jgi:hypothetical protein
VSAEPRRLSADLQLNHAESAASKLAGTVLILTA